MKVIVKWPVQHHSRLVMRSGKVGFGYPKTWKSWEKCPTFLIPEPEKWYSNSTQTHLLLPELIKTPKKPTWTRPITNSTPISQKSEKTIRPAFNEEGFECISYMYVCRYIHIYLLAPKKFCWTKFIFHMVSFLSFLQQNSLCPLNFFLKEVKFKDF